MADDFSPEGQLAQAIPGFKEWGDLDLNFAVVAKIDADTCIGCQLCYIACLDGAHQCIHTRKGPCSAFHDESDHGDNPRLEVQPPVRHEAENGVEPHVPFVDEAECIGCNLCHLVCPVPGCITMEEIPNPAGSESWNERMARGKA